MEFTTVSKATGWARAARLVAAVGLVALSGAVSAQIASTKHNLGSTQTDKTNNTHTLGTGELDYTTYLKRLAALPGDVPLMIEHMQGEEEYDKSRRYLFELGEKIGVSFGADA